MASVQNLGQFLSGDRIASSPYRLEMKVEMFCEQLCVSNIGRAEKKKGEISNTMVRAIRAGYHNNWIVDNVPSAYRSETQSMIVTRYWGGFPIGFIDPRTGLSYIHNHVNLQLHYREVEPGAYRITRFIVTPMSIRHDFEMIHEEENDEQNLNQTDRFSNNHPRVAKIINPIPSCDPLVRKSRRMHTGFEMVGGSRQNPQPASGKVLFTYDVIWLHNPDLYWTKRWDIYLYADDAIPAKVHWYSIMNSAFVLLLLALFVVSIYVRSLRRQYNRVATEEEAGSNELMDVKRNERWKLVYADVFRPPDFSPLLLSVFCGTGAQIMSGLLLTIGLACGGFLSPSKRGSFAMAALVLYSCSGVVGGLVATQLCRAFGGENWHRTCTLTALGFPGLCFVLFILSQALALVERSTYAVPFSYVLILLFMWLVLSVPLTIVGGNMANNRPPMDFPFNPSKDAPRRPIPSQPCRTNFVLQFVLSAILPFGAFIVEFYFIMMSWWYGGYYYEFPFLFLVLGIMILTCGGATILLCLFQLNSENHRWWWRAFFNGGSFGLGVFVYSCFVYSSAFESIGLAPLLYYLGFMGLVSLGLMMLGGFVGVWSSLWFNKQLYSLINTNEESEETDALRYEMM